MFGQEYTSIEPPKKKQEPKPLVPTKPSAEKPGPSTVQPKVGTKVPMNIQSAQEDMKRKMTENKKAPAIKKKEDNCLLF